MDSQFYYVQPNSSTAAAGGEEGYWTNGQARFTLSDIKSLSGNQLNDFSSPQQISNFISSMYYNNNLAWAAPPVYHNRPPIPYTGPTQFTPLSAPLAAYADASVGISDERDSRRKTRSTLFGPISSADLIQTQADALSYYEKAANEIADNSFQHENTNTVEDDEIHLLRSNSNLVVNGLMQYVIPSATADEKQDAITMIDDVQTNLDNVEKIYKNTKNYINVFGELLDPTWTPWINIFGEEKILYCLLFGIELPVEKYIEELEKMSGGVGSTDKSEKREWRLTFLRMMIYILNAAGNFDGTRRTDNYGSSPLNDYFKRMLGYFNGNPFSYFVKNLPNHHQDYTSGVGHSGLKIGKPCCGIWAGGNIITSYAKLLLNIINHNRFPPEPLDGINATPGFKESILYQRIVKIIYDAPDKDQLIAAIERVADMSYSDLDCNGCIIVEDDTQRLRLFTDATNSNRDPQFTGNHYYGIDEIHAAKEIVKANLKRLGIVVPSSICGFYLFRIKNKIPFKVSEKYQKLKTDVEIIKDNLSISDKNIANGLVACGIEKLFPGGAEKDTLKSLKSNIELISKLKEYYFKHLFKKNFLDSDVSFMEKIMEIINTGKDEKQRIALYDFLKQKHDVTYRKLENDILSNDKWYNSKLDKKTGKKTVNKTRMNMGKKILLDHCRFLTDNIIGDTILITGNDTLRTEFVGAYKPLSVEAPLIDEIKMKYDEEYKTHIVTDYNTLSKFLTFSQNIHLKTISVWQKLYKNSDENASILRSLAKTQINYLTESLTLIQTKISELAELSITDRTNRQLTQESHANNLTLISNAHSTVEKSLNALADKYAIFSKIFELIPDEQTLFDTLSLARDIFKIFSENDHVLRKEIQNEKSVIRDITEDWITDYYELNVLTLNAMVTGHENTDYIEYLNQNPDHNYLKYATYYVLSCEQFYELILLQKKYNNALTAFNVLCTIKIMKDTLGAGCSDLRAITYYLNMMMQDFTKNITISETNPMQSLESISSLESVSKSELPTILIKILSSYLKHASTKPILDLIKETIKTSGLQVDDEEVPLIIYEDRNNIETNKTIGNSIRSIPSESSCVSINPSKPLECKEINNSSITMSAELKLLIAGDPANDLQGLTSTSNYIITQPNTFDDVDLADAVEDGCRLIEPYGLNEFEIQIPKVACGVGGGKMRRKMRNNIKIKKTKKNKKSHLKNTKNKKAQNRKTKQQKQPKQKISKKRNKM
jgi:hypothetical protein